MNLYFYSINNSFFDKPFIAENRAAADKQYNKEKKTFLEAFKRQLDEIKLEVKEREDGYKAFVKRLKKGIDILKKDLSKEERVRRLKKLDIAEDEFIDMLKEDGILDSIAATSDVYKEYKAGKDKALEAIQFEYDKLEKGEVNCFVIASESK